ncbi:amino acid permease [Desulfofundulus sp.]|uniref:amino acid permease n=1 Tax=Desulfofundulus sp. TaxID=2282750 RepID=UPI003C78DDBE
MIKDLFRKKTPEMIQDTVEHSRLKRELSAFDLALIGISCVIGTGIFVATGQGASLAGPGVILSYAVAAICCALCAFTYAELATMFPIAGSTYSFCYAAFGEIIAWIIGWDLLLEYLVSSSAVASGWSSTLVGVLRSMGINLPHALTNSPLAGGIVDLPAVLVVMFITWILYRGVKESANWNNAMVAVKVGVIVLFIIMGMTHVHLVNLKPLLPFGWKGVMAGASIVFFAFIGFDDISTAAEETANPKRDVPLGVGICVAVVILLYMLVAFTLCGIVPFRQIDVNDALPSALRMIGINWGGDLVAVGGIVGMIATILVINYGQIRIFMTMARDGLLPPAFEKIHPVCRTPHICTWITGIICAVIAGFFPFSVIIDLCNIGTLFAFILVSIGVIVLRKTMPDVERKFRLPGVPFTPLLTIAMCVYLMAYLSPWTWLRFAIWLIVGGSLYFLYGYKHSALRRNCVEAPTTEA